MHVWNGSTPSLRCNLESSTSQTPGNKELTRTRVVIYWLVNNLETKDEFNETRVV